MPSRHIAARTVISGIVSCGRLFVVLSRPGIPLRKNSAVTMLAISLSNIFSPFTIFIASCRRRSQYVVITVLL